VTYLRELSAIEIWCDQPMGVQADGEYLGERVSVEVAAAPDALSVIR
jgi:diacylglycerol kinase family enzyme